MIKTLRKKLHQLFTICFDFLQDLILWVFEHDYFVFLGFIPIFYLIYRRVFYIRTPKNLLFDPKDVTLLQIGIYFWLMAIFSYLLYRYCQKRWFPKEPKELPFLVKFWLTIWVNYLDKRAKTFYTFINSILPSYDVILYSICYILFKYPHYCRTLIIIIYPLPKIIISLFFLVDIFYFHKFYYFYLSLYLLILPLIYNALYYVLKQFYHKASAKVDEIIGIEDVIVNNKSFTKVGFILPEMSEQLDLSQYLQYIYYPVKYLLAILVPMDILKTEIMSKVNPFVYLINIIGWGYLFFYALVII